MKILFGLNQSSDNTTEEKILKVYQERTNQKFKYKKEFDLMGIRKYIASRGCNVLILNELLERQSPVTSSFLDDLTDNYSDLRIIFVVDAEEHEEDNYIPRLFNIGIYDVVYSYDLSIEILADLITNPRTKAEAKAYLEINEIEDVIVESELEYIPKEELDKILAHFSIAEEDMIVPTFEHVCRQYNNKQVLFLLNLLPSNIVEVLDKNDNKKYKEYEKQLGYDVINDRKHVNSFNKSHSKGKDKLPNIITKKEIIVKEKLAGTVSISIAGLQRGCGVTFTTLRLGKFLTDRGYKVAIVELANKNKFSMIYLSTKKNTQPFNYKGIDVYANNGKDSPEELLLLSTNKKYDFLIYDVGLLFVKDNSSEYENAFTEVKNYKKGPFYNEFMRSSTKILLTFSDSLHFDSLGYFSTYIEKWNIGGIKVGFSRANKHDNKNIKAIKNLGLETFIIPNIESYSFSDEETDCYESILSEVLPSKTVRRNPLNFLRKIIFSGNRG